MRGMFFVALRVTPQKDAGPVHCRQSHSGAVFDLHMSWNVPLQYA